MREIRNISIATGGALFLAVLTTAEAQSYSRPNIVFILADDLGYGDLGCYGQKKIETPNIDQLATQGIRFLNHYSGQAVSAPSRCVLMTGLHTGHAQIRQNMEAASRGDVWSHKAMLENPTLEGQAPMRGNTRTLIHLMKEAGYATGIIGKWGLGYPGSETTPNKMGFDFFYGYNCQRQAHTYYPMFLYRNEAREYLDNAPLLTPSEKLAETDDCMNPKSYAKFSRKEYANDNMFTEITNFVDNNASKPFFLMWTTPLPHVSLQAPQRWIDYYVEKFGNEKPYLGERGYLPTRYPRATYAAMVSYFDEQVGKLVKHLKELGVYENTIIVFTSDNGPTFNGGSDSPFFNSAGIYRSEQGWGKASLREGGIRVPMIVSWPEVIKSPRESHHISAFWDFVPTFADITGKKWNNRTDGISLKNELLGKPQKKHPYLYWEYPEGTGSKAVRMGKWKGYLPNTKKGNTKIELYNIEVDPQEQFDQATSNPTIVAQIEQIIVGAHEEL